MVIIMDVDITEYLDFTSYGIASILGSMLEWLIKEINYAIATRVKQLPKKAIKADYPQIYWVAAPIHMNFHQQMNKARKKFNLCLHSIIKQTDNMHVIKLKEFVSSFHHQTN